MPRRSSSFVPKYRKHRASGQAVVTISGRDHYLGPHGSKASRLEYDRLIGEWLTAGRFASVEPQTSLTIIELLARYWAFAKDYYVKDGQSTGTTEAIRAAVRFLKDRYGTTPADQFGPLALKAVRQRMIDTDLSRAYVNKLVAIICRMFRWAAAEQLIPVTVPQALAMVPGLRKGRSEAREPAPITPVDDSAVDSTLEHLPPIVADMVRFQRFTGCRPEEVCALRPCDMDRSNDVWMFRPGSHKTEHQGRDRMIFVGPKAQEVLLRYLARDAQSHCFRPCDSEAKRLAEQERNRKTPLSCGNVRGSNVKRKPRRKPGTQYTTRSYRRAIHRACDKAGIARWSPNRLRHSTATKVRKEFGLKGAQIILGHASADVSQVYAERDIAKGLEIARRIG
jgi:integrase